MPATINTPLTASWQLALSAPGGTITVSSPCEWAITDTSAEPLAGVVRGHILQSYVDRDFALITGERVYVRSTALGVLIATPAGS